MLHSIPNSSKRRQLLQVVWLQRRLILRLCSLPEGSGVDEAWLQSVWPRVPQAWIKRFWENDKGNRATWCGTIAAAKVAEKTSIREWVEQQLRFRELYASPPSVRLTVRKWDTPVLKAVNQMLKAFYAPLFYQTEGFPCPNAQTFHKEIFLAGILPRIKICPYTDTKFQDTKLDHFLPKDDFPMLSNHPDNLIPCSTDSNSGGHKGTKIPLDRDEQDQAANWFHPRWRSAMGTYRLSFSDATPEGPQARFEALASSDQPRLERLNQMFGLTEFWSRDLDDEVQFVGSEISEGLKSRGETASEANCRRNLEELAKRKRGRIGQDSLAIVSSGFYDHILTTPSLLAQIVRTCVQGT